MPMFDENDGEQFQATLRLAQDIGLNRYTQLPVTEHTPYKTNNKICRADWRAIASKLKNIKYINTDTINNKHIYNNYYTNKNTSKAHQIITPTTFNNKKNSKNIIKYSHNKNRNQVIPLKQKYLNNSSLNKQSRNQYIDNFQLSRFTNSISNNRPNTTFNKIRKRSINTNNSNIITPRRNFTSNSNRSHHISHINNLSNKSHISQLQYESKLIQQAKQIKIRSMTDHQKRYLLQKLFKQQNKYNNNINNNILNNNILNNTNNTILLELQQDQSQQIWNNPERLNINNNKSNIPERPKTQKLKNQVKLKFNKKNKLFQFC